MNDINEEIMNEDDADLLLNEINDEDTPLEQDPAPQTPQEYAIKYGGKEIKAPIDKILRWAEQGYDAPNKIGDLNKKLAEWSQKEQQLKELDSRYGAVDKYVRENPQWWQHVQSQYDQLQNQSQGQMQNDPLLSVIDPLKKEIEQLRQGYQTIEQERAEKRMQEEDAQYTNELETLKKTYPKVDFSSTDESGKTLEYKVLQYANENGIKKFTTAFRDFYHDELLKMHEEQAKEKVVADRVSKTKLGILGVSPTPSRKVSSDSVKGKSYADLEREALAELGLR